LQNQLGFDRTDQLASCHIVTLLHLTVPTTLSLQPFTPHRGNLFHLRIHTAS
jgi:hypothetical protein